MKGAIANVVGNGISALIGKCVDVATSLYDLAESRRKNTVNVGSWNYMGKCWKVY